MSPRFQQASVLRHQLIIRMVQLSVRNHWTYVGDDDLPIVMALCVFVPADDGASANFGIRNLLQPWGNCRNDVGFVQSAHSLVPRTHSSSCSKSRRRQCCFSYHVVLVENGRMPSL